MHIPGDEYFETLERSFLNVETLTKCQLTQTFCERLFGSSSNARIGVSERQSGRVDSGIFLAVCGRLTAVEKTL